MRLSLTKKIAGGFIIILALLIVLAFAGRMGLTRVVDKMDSANRFQVLVDRILDARQNEKQFILANDAKSVDMVTKDIQTLTSKANDILAAASDEEIRQQARHILKAATAYLEAFKAYVSLAGERDGLMADMNLKASNALEITSRIRDGQRSRYEDLKFESETKTGEMRSRVVTADRIKENFLQARGFHLAINAWEEGNAALEVQWKGHMDNIKRALDDSAALMAEDVAKKRHQTLAETRDALVEAANRFFSDRSPENNQTVVKATNELRRAVIAFQQEMQELLEFYVEDVRIFSGQAMALSSGADAIANILLKTRILEKEFIRTQDEALFNKIVDDTAAIDTTVSGIKEAIDDEDKTKPLDGIREAVNNYIRSFKSNADLMKRQQTAKTTMESNAAGIQSVCLNSKDIMRRQMLSQITRSTVFLTIVSVGAVILGIIIAVYLSRIIIRPLKRVAGALKDIAQGEGDLTQRIEINTKDEIGELAKWFNIFLARLNNIIVDIGANSETVTASSGELLVTAEQMAEDSKELSGRSNAVAAAAEEMSASMNSVAAASGQASTNLGMIADSAGQMKHTITEVAQNCDKARTVTEDAVQKASAASRRVERLGASANDINQVTEVITDIAEQTNLLALNATIEAARAGEAGKGFAVVASEIKGLADQTTKATLNIKEKVEGIQTSTNDTVRDVEAISGVISEVTDIVAAIAAAIEEQSVSATEVAENIEQASTGIGSVNENVARSSRVSSEIAADISGVSRVSEEMTVQSDRMTQNAHDLSDLSAKLRDMIGVFKVSVADADPDVTNNVKMEDVPDLMPWGNRYKIGIPSIDEQHKELVRMVNDLHRAMKARAGASEAGTILKDLAAYTVFHFKHEEDLFDAHAYPETQAHKQYHSALVEKVTAFKSEFDEGRAALSMDLMVFLTDWLKDHIQKKDMAYGPFLKEQGVT